MAVIIGSARSDERGKATGGQAGDQTGREVSTQNWYKSSKGWVLLRPADPAKAAKIAAAMRAACDNPRIGYDQAQRLTLYNAVKALGFDPSKVTTPVETDCSALVRVCCAAAGIEAGNFTTANQVKVLMSTGEFDRLVDKQYTAQSAYLRAGDILVTATRGHTVVVLTAGPKGGSGDKHTLCRGSAGPATRRAQQRLIDHGYALPLYGADSDFGAETEAVTRAFQAAKRLEVDGVIGPATWGALAAQPAGEQRYVYTLRSTDAGLLERLQGLYGGTVVKG